MNRLELGKEYLRPDEEEFMATIREVIRKSLEKDYQPGNTKRRFHAKSLGLVDAELTVAGDVPEHLRVGLFKTAKTYKALVRFSNAAKKPVVDHKKGHRGMAIKVLDTGVQPMDPDEDGNTQDFLLTTATVLAPGTLKRYMIANRALFGQIWYFIGFVLNPLNWKTLLTINAGRPDVANILETEFFSSTPYLFGEDKAIKWHARPLKAKGSSIPANPHDDFLTHRLKDDLQAGAHAFELCIQEQTNPSTEPVEDSEREWKTPFTKVATLTILQQDFDTEERKSRSEVMSFSPWHCLPAHRPLGANNRARRVLYSEMWRFRNQRNGVGGV